MRSKLVLLLVVSIAVVAASIDVSAQKKAVKGKICGDPTQKCKGAENFQTYDLVFDTGKNFVIAQSEKFYGIVLKSVKLNDWGDCGHPSFGEDTRLLVQELFPHNKVFALNCVESGTNFYPGVAEKTAFVAVYAGRTLAEANKFLKTVQATGKFPGVRVRSMSIEVNGT